MATSADIQNISDQIRREFAPRKIILFGSHSWGTPSDDSDVDLLVIVDFEGKPWRFAVEIRDRQTHYPARFDGAYTGAASGTSGKARYTADRNCRPGTVLYEA